MIGTENIIEINGLTKSYGGVKAVNDISFKVKRGEFFAFLGINGAGKSTTISIMCGQLSKNSGKVIIDGIDLDSGSQSVDIIKTRLGVVFQSSALDKVLTVRENLKSRAALYGICDDDFKKKLDYLTELFSLSDILDRRTGKLSGGQLRRVDIARALINDPDILILDEPTTGLDPQTRKSVWEIINQLRNEREMTVFLTTHYMEEAVDADYIVILDSGKVVANGTPLELKNKYTGDFITIYNINEDEIKKLNMPYTVLQSAFRIEVSNTQEATKLIVSHPEIFNDYEIIKGKMDDVFINATGKNLGE